MFLPSCDALANEQPSLVDVITKLDRTLARDECRSELLIPQLAYIVEEDEELVGNLLEQLVARGAVTKEERVCCPDQHHLFTSDDIREAQENGESLRCPECGQWLRGDLLTAVPVFSVHEEPRYPVDDSPSAPQRVLVVSANPTLDQLALDQEIRRIQSALTLVQTQVEVALDIRLAATVEDLRAALLRAPPNIVHFCGHGLRGGLVFATDLGNSQSVPAAALAQLFSSFRPTLQCVVMNACYSDSQAKRIASHISYVVGMRGKLEDEAAVEFSTGFYQGLAGGKSILACFKLGYGAIALGKFPGKKKPLLWLKGTRYEAGSEPTESSCE